MAQERGANVFWAARRERWRKVLAAWLGSGLSQAEYCRRERLKLATFNGWKQRLGKAAAETPEPGPFVAVRVKAAESAGAHHATAGIPLIEIVLRNGRTLRTGANIEAAALSRLAAALEQ